MDLHRWAKIEEIFEATLERPPDARAEFIIEQCAGDSQLQAEVNKLIARFERDEGFLESPVWTDSQILHSEIKREIADSLEKEITAEGENNSSINRRIGVYQLTKELGKGGMGEVFLAERADGEFEQKVAIKLIKRGMDTDFILRRFRQERQIAARLNHPNIARLIDGGSTSDDLPYFVMEYVEGESIFKYAESKRLGLRGKLNLFLRVCAAVAYAHRKKIIHRDIKPGNILVSDDGMPKLLDFGIAKILDPDLIHESIMPTATQMRLMTPEYASPEQVRGDEVTEASDQYSLGVLLYELITGERPYKFASRAPHEIARIICEEIPSEPSSGGFGRSISDSAETLLFDNVSDKNLDRIVLKALRKIPPERYGSVMDLAADIERFLGNKDVYAESFADEKNGKTIGADMQTPTLADQKAIAVLPFRFLNQTSVEQAAGEFLGIGLADALITRLSNVRQFVVRPTSSVLRFNNAATDSSEVGRELDVGFILEGNILRTGTRIRISVQLLNVSENSTVWAERFDEELADALTLEDVISKRVAESLVPRLSTGDRLRLMKRGTDQPKAYEAYLRGRFYWNTFTEESFARAFTAYHEAIAHDANYALAYAGIADYYIWLGVYGVVPPQDCYPQAKDAAQRAIELDDELAEAHAAPGFARLCGDFDWTKAEKNVVRAIEINPNYAVAHLWYSYVLQSAGRFENGIAQARRAVELDPLTYTNYHVLAWAFYFARRFDEAVAQAAYNVEKFPGIGLAYFTQSWILRFLGRHRESLNASRRATQLSGDSLFVLLGHAQALAAAGEKAATETTLQSIFARGERQYLSYYQVALVYAYENENKKALVALERAFADREGWFIWLGTEPALDKLRSEPRFIKLREKIDVQTIKAKIDELPAPSEEFSAVQSSLGIAPFAAPKTMTDAPEQNKIALRHESQTKTVLTTSEGEAKSPVAFKYAAAAIIFIIAVYILHRLILAG